MQLSILGLSVLSMIAERCLVFLKLLDDRNRCGTETDVLWRLSGRAACSGSLTLSFQHSASHPACPRIDMKSPHLAALVGRDISNCLDGDDASPRSSSTMARW